MGDAEQMSEEDYDALCHLLKSEVADTVDTIRLLLDEATEELDQFDLDAVELAIDTIEGELEQIREAARTIGNGGVSPQGDDR